MSRKVIMVLFCVLTFFSQGCPMFEGCCGPKESEKQLSNEEVLLKELLEVRKQLAGNIAQAVRQNDVLDKWEAQVNNLETYAKDFSGESRKIKWTLEFKLFFGWMVVVTIFVGGGYTLWLFREKMWNKIKTVLHKLSNFSTQEEKGVTMPLD